MEDKVESVHPAVELLLARMDHHPREFRDDIKWGNKYQPYKSHWNSTEKQLVAAKLREIRMDAMREVIAKELLK